MGVMQMYVPMPTEEIYRTLGPVRKKLSRILLYIVQSFTDRDMDIETYTECHKIIGAAWRRMNEDLEFCEQLELELPRSRQWHRDREWGAVHDETYFTKEALMKAIESYKQNSASLPAHYTQKRTCYYNIRQTRTTVFYCENFGYMSDSI